MPKLFCAIVGFGTVFGVDIDHSDTVSDLKEKIKQKSPNRIYFEAALLNLYLAKRGGSWLNICSNDMEAVERKEIPATIKALMTEPMEETRQVMDSAYLGPQFVREDDDIHVLVELPPEPELEDPFLGVVSSLLSPWAFLQSLFSTDKAPQTKKDA